MAFIVTLIHQIFQILTFIVLADTIISYFMDPYNPVRQFLDRIVQPMLAPIRRVLPPTGMLDFSPLVLIVVLQILDQLLIRLLLSV